MPIYVYKCDKGHIFELLQKIGDPAPPHCQECDAPVKKALTTAGLIGQTSGFKSESVTPEAAARFAGGEGGKAQRRREDVFIQKLPGFDKRKAGRKSKKSKP